MKKKEMELFKTLCDCNTEKVDDVLIKYASPNVLGELFFNRMTGVAFDTLKKTGTDNKVNREFRNSLKASYEHNIAKNKSFIRCINYLKCILSYCDCKYAMLKGAVLCGLYPRGYRTSNDIDLLVMPEDVTKIGDILRSAGFEQGKIKNNRFVPATRKEIIESKMMRGECVPYIKQVDLPYMKYLEVDLNFSLDYKTGDSTVINKMFDAIHSKKIGKSEVLTLCDADFFIHLSVHLYKEATTLPWVKMKRDMTLYKFFDIYMLLNKMTHDDIKRLFVRAKELDLDKICSYAIITTNAFFNIDNPIVIKLAKDILKDNQDFTHTVISPSDKKKYVYKCKNIFERLFMSNRMGNLEEV